MDQVTGNTTNILNYVSKSTQKLVFSWYDYTFFTIMLGASAVIGIYFGCFGQKQSTPNEYLLGGKQMKVIPISLSMIASAISGLTILAVPADIYNFGATFWISCISAAIIAALTYFIYLPVFYKLQLISTYEYLKIRFNTNVRIMASVLFTISMILYLPIVVYVPALAFSHVTDINIHFITPIICSVCIFYTTIGGLKAVVWTDALQFSAMLGAMAVVFVLGIINVGGFKKIWLTSLEGGRLDIDMDINPLKKDTFWAIVLGFSTNWISHIGINQGIVQKFISLPTMKDCKRATIFLAIGMILNKTFSVWVGLMMYTKYHDCDPVKSGLIEKADQLVPYFVMDIAANIPGLPGLFIAGLFCASLSTLSAVMNSLSGTLYEDFISRFMPKDISQKSVSNILKALVLLIGIVSTALVFVVERLGSLFPLTMSFASVASGPLVGLFTLGMTCPSANSKGALIGGITSLSFLSWIMIGAQYYKAKGLFYYTPKPTSTDSCEFAVNITSSLNDSPGFQQEDEVFCLYKITFYYYTLIGALIVIAVGQVVSWMTKTDDPPIHKDLISPCLHCLLPENKPVKNETKYYTVDKALSIVDSDETKNNKS